MDVYYIKKVDKTEFFAEKDNKLPSIKILNYEI